MDAHRLELHQAMRRQHEDDLAAPVWNFRGPPVLFPQRVLDRIWDHIDSSDGPDACWPWQRSTHRGYGQISWDEDGKRVTGKAHRAAWTATHGVIPVPMTIDHICRNRGCCNPSHLRLLTNSENASLNGYALRTHCPHGHPYAGDNLAYAGNGSRRCLACEKSKNDARFTTRVGYCERCGARFVTRQSRKRYCTNRCASAVSFARWAAKRKAER